MCQHTKGGLFIEPAHCVLIVVFRRHQSFTDEPRIAPGEQIIKIGIKRQCHVAGQLSVVSGVFIALPGRRLFPRPRPLGCLPDY